ncbi:MAG TPA: redoxin domain-containing protein, partial [Gammaproteobacteria bacterium]|nr:redoxin domain-containing protein [Gammaproteobacteria bacterium]
MLSLQSVNLFAAEDESSNPPAIEFSRDLPWLNVSRPLTLAELRGKVVILDFWTYGCINCMHVLKDLDRLEKKYGNSLVVIGVHTPKFENEKNIDTLRRIVVRYDIEHPVINDVESKMARLYGMRAWPTQYVIDPLGSVLGKVEGEGNYEVLDEV